MFFGNFSNDQPKIRFSPLFLRIAHEFFNNQICSFPLLRHVFNDLMLLDKRQSQRQKTDVEAQNPRQHWVNIFIAASFSLPIQESPVKSAHLFRISLLGY